MKRLLAGALLLAFGATPGAWAQGADTTRAPRKWSFAIEAYNYFIPDAADLFLPIVAADRGALHLEARYNYEDLETGSLWAGWTFAREGTVSFAVTPIVGGVFGNTDGAGVGVEAEVTVGPLELFTEAEYVVDFDDGANNFIYSWSELSVYPTEWLRAGIIGQRLRSNQSGLEVERGLLAGVQRGRVNATVYALNIGTDSRFFLVGLGLEF